MSTVKPISPNDIAEAKKTLVFPPKVIETWNFLIAKNWTEGRSIVYQNEAIELLMKNLGIEERNDIFHKKYLEIEDVYRAEGWTVVYDKPAYYETYEPSFTFRKKK